MKLVLVVMIAETSDWVGRGMGRSALKAMTVVMTMARACGDGLKKAGSRAAGLQEDGCRARRSAHPPPAAVYVMGK